MRRHLLLLFACCTVAALCEAQPIPPKKVDRNKDVERDKEPERQEENRKISVPVIIQANHDFYLTIDGKPSGKYSKDNPKELRLLTGIRRLQFEEADSTGEMQQRFVEIKSSSKKRDTVAVVFSADFAGIQSGYGNKSAVVFAGNPPADPKLVAVATELLQKMVVVEGGTFPMGSGDRKDEVQHEVTVGTFNLGKYEITQREWEAVMGYNNSDHRGDPDYPVENVSWDEVQQFVEKLNNASLKKFRLPTEAEWEYTAWKMMTKEFTGATREKEISARRKRFYDRAAVYANQYNGLAPVGKKEAALGIFDLFGNVAEWCADFYTADYQNLPGQNPAGPESGSKRVIRGGSYQDKEDDLRLSLRNADFPAAKRKSVGFRLATSID